MEAIEAEPARANVRANDSALRDWVRALEGTAPVAASPQRLLYHVIAELADAQGDAPALIAVGGESLTYRALIERANRYAHWALDQGLAKNETVCLMMPNRPEYLAIWLGLTNAGVVVALINTELRGHSLAHCIDIVSPKHVIVAAECVAQFQSAAAQLMSGAKVWLHGGSGDGFEHIGEALEHRPQR
jgi:fatty-acyl-CoA synthase